MLNEDDYDCEEDDYECEEVFKDEWITVNKVFKYGHLNIEMFVKDNAGDFRGFVCIEETARILVVTPEKTVEVKKDSRW